MRWYEPLYIGEKTKKHQTSVIQAILRGRRSGYYVIAPASNGKNLLELYPAHTFTQPYYREKDMLIVGIADDFPDAAEVAGRIVADMYRQTETFDISAFLNREDGQGKS